MVPVFSIFQPSLGDMNVDIIPQNKNPRNAMVYCTLYLRICIIDICYKMIARALTSQAAIQFMGNFNYVHIQMGIYFLKGG